MSNRETTPYEFVGSRRIVNVAVQDENGKFRDAWGKYAAYVHANARKFSRSMHNAVGCEYEDLVQIGQLMLVQALRTYDDKSGASFLTYFATLVNNRFRTMHADEYAHREFELTMTGRGRPQKVVTARGVHAAQTAQDIARADGYAVKTREVKTGTKRTPIPTDMTRIVDKGTGTNLDNHPRLQLTECSTKRVEYVEEVINRKVSDERMRRLALALYRGHTPGEIRRELGMTKMVYHRQVLKVRARLADEFDQPVPCLS